MNREIVTRFAPSPTGFLHIGNARTALFNWLYARHVGGKFFLRIEDTDRERSSDSAVDKIFSGLKWLGLDWDGEAIFQFARADRHRDIAYELLLNGKAYKSYSTPEEIEAIKEQAKLEGKRAIYPGRDEIIKEDKPFVIRLKTPLEGETVNNDLIQGRVVIDNTELDDMVLLRSDGTPTYMLAVVVDDHDMGVTHVIRGDDHLTNAARQIQIYKAMEWSIPVFAHMPLIHGEDGAKLSKRHGALSVDWYAEEGYLPEAMRNYLARLGWSHGDDEIFSTEQAVEWFDVKDINKAPSRLDFDKLGHVNGLYIRGLATEELIERLDNYQTIIGKNAFNNEQKQILLQVIDLFKDRAKTLKDLNEQMQFLMSDQEIQCDEQALTKLGEKGVKARIIDFIPYLENIIDWNETSIDTQIKTFLSDKGLKMPAIGPVIRACIAGRVNTPNIPPILNALGKAKTLNLLRKNG